MAQMASKETIDLHRPEGMSSGFCNAQKLRNSAIVQFVRESLQVQWLRSGMQTLAKR
jgi:hypothetical protein